MKNRIVGQAIKSLREIRMKYPKGYSAYLASLGKYKPASKDWYEA